jgi:arsenical pump membrane protein
VRIAFLIFLVTLVLVIWQPRGLGIGWSAAAGAVVALLAGVIHLADIPVVWHIVWNATGTFVAVIIISLLLDKAGFFEWAALHVARWGRGSGRRLFVLLVLLGASVASLFANDGAALILTPIVIAMLRALRFPAKATLAFVTWSILCRPTISTSVLAAMPP